LTAARVNADRRAHGVHDVDALGLAQLPGPRVVRPRPVRQRADGAKINDVRAHLGEHSVFEVGRDLGVLTTADQTQFLDARHLGHVSDTARAVDAARHDRLDQGAEVFVLNRALVLGVARAADTERHRLVLQVAFAALIADRAVQRGIDKQELHHAFARLLHQRTPGADDLGRAIFVRRQVTDAHRAGGDRLRDAGDLDEAHPAIAGDRQALVVAEARDLGARLLARLQQRRAVLYLDRQTVDD